MVYLFRGDDDELMVGTWGVEIWNWSESIEWISSVETGVKGSVVVTSKKI